MFSNKELNEIPHILSEPRFATYLRHCKNNKSDALALYKWNLQVSSAFITPLHLLEISTRNAVVEALNSVHSQNWPWNNGFIRSLTDPVNGYSPKQDLKLVSQREPTVGKVVAELKFIFWERMFTSRFDERLWKNNIKNIFPNTPQHLQTHEIRSQIYHDIFTIRKLRNRIAHHEPIFSRTLDDDLDKMLRLIRWRNATAAQWIENIQIVTPLLQNPPVFIQ